MASKSSVRTSAQRCTQAFPSPITGTTYPQRSMNCLLLPAFCAGLFQLRLRTLRAVYPRKRRAAGLLNCVAPGQVERRHFGPLPHRLHPRPTHRAPEENAQLLPPGPPQAHLRTRRLRRAQICPQPMRRQRAQNCGQLSPLNETHLVLSSTALHRRRWKTVTTSLPCQDPSLAVAHRPALRRQTGPLPTCLVLLHKTPWACRRPQRKSLPHSSLPQRRLQHNAIHHRRTSSRRRGPTLGPQSSPQHRRLLLPRLPAANRPHNEDLAPDSVLRHRASMAQTPLPHHGGKLHHPSPLILKKRNKPLPSQPVPIPISRAQIRLPRYADIGPNPATATFTRFGPSFGMRITPRLMRQQGFRSRDAQSR